MIVDPKFSLIIPSHNAQNSIRQCLDAVFALERAGSFEVILADDGSKDQTLGIAQKYSCRIVTIDSNRGASFARNRGAEQAKGEILLFVDSDVVLPGNTLSIILDAFSRAAADCVVGLFSAENPYPDFFSQYKSYYCYFKYRELPQAVAVNTAITAVKRNVFEKLHGFDEKMLGSEDNEFAQRLFDQGFKIFIEHDLHVLHLKKFTFSGLLRNDFLKSGTLAQVLARNLRNRNLIVKRSFTDISLTNMLNVPLVYGAEASGAAWWITRSDIFLAGKAVLLLAFVLNNIRFWKYLHSQKGAVFMLWAVIFTYVDYLAVGLGIVRGFYAAATERK